MDIKPRISEEKPDKAKPWELMEVLNSQQCCVATMPENPDQPSKVWCFDVCFALLGMELC
jgi:hypothetical protein